MTFVCSMRAGCGDITKVLEVRKVSDRNEREREREPPRSAEAAATPPIQEGSLDPGGRGRKGKPSGTALWQAASVGRELFGRVWFSEEEVGGFN